MGKQIDSFCDGLKEQLNAVDARLQAAKLNLESLPSKSEKAMNDSLNELRATFKIEKDRMKQAKKTLKTQAEGVVQDAKDSINDWKANRDFAKLTHHADKAESKAIDAIQEALAMVGAAEEAILEAAIARAEANEDKKTPLATVS